ncbi:MAG TPA: hypothetical protein VKQ08_10345 [Cyclobacteriaceae bacterium]|nr:hypothetical protein [Cyclobacteriaceae bacterium]
MSGKADGEYNGDPVIAVIGRSGKRVYVKQPPGGCEIPCEFQPLKIEIAL